MPQAAALVTIVVVTVAVSAGLVIAGRHLAGPRAGEGSDPAQDASAPASRIDIRKPLPTAGVIRLASAWLVLCGVVLLLLPVATAANRLGGGVLWLALAMCAVPLPGILYLGRTVFTRGDPGNQQAGRGNG